MPPPIRLAVLDPDTPHGRGIVKKGGSETIVITGHDQGVPDLVCGQCEAVLARHVHRDAFARLLNLAVICNGCGAALNDLAPQRH